MKALGYICRNPGAHSSNVMCSSCIPYYREAERIRLTIK